MDIAAQCSNGTKSSQQIPSVEITMQDAKSNVSSPTSPLPCQGDPLSQTKEDTHLDSGAPHAVSLDTTESGPPNTGQIPTESDPRNTDQIPTGTTNSPATIQYSQKIYLTRPPSFKPLWIKSWRSSQTLVSHQKVSQE